MVKFSSAFVARFRIDSRVFDLVSIDKWISDKNNIFYESFKTRSRPLYFINYNFIDREDTLSFEHSLNNFKIV